jgi:hypothetical protein
MRTTLQITFKHADAVDYAKYDFHQANETAYSNLTDKEMDAFTDKLDNTIDKFVRSGEYVTIEFDIEAGTAIVVPTKRG